MEESTAAHRARAMRRITFRLPSTLQQLLHESFVSTYGARGKSRWVREALQDMFENDRELSWVGRGEALVDENDAAEMFSISSELDDKLTVAATIVRRQDPLIEGIQSKIVRGAIRRKLYREGQSLPWPRKSTSAKGASEKK